MLDIDGEHNISTHLIQWNNEGVTLQDKDIWPARSEGRYDGRYFQTPRMSTGLVESVFGFTYLMSRPQ
jgi:hypothetical protein